MFSCRYLHIHALISVLITACTVYGCDGCICSSPYTYTCLLILLFMCDFIFPAWEQAAELRPVSDAAAALCCPGGFTPTSLPTPSRTWRQPMVSEHRAFPQPIGARGVFKGFEPRDVWNQTNRVCVGGCVSLTRLNLNSHDFVVRFRPPFFFFFLPAFTFPHCLKGAVMLSLLQKASPWRYSGGLCSREPPVNWST